MDASAADWGSVPDWVGAIGTVGALIAGVIVFAVDLKHRREERTDAAKDQARHLAAWIVGTPEVSGKAPALSARYPVRVINRSDLPVYDCLVRIQWPGGSEAHHRILGTLAPGYDTTVELALAARMIQAWPEVSLGFTDAGGRPWRQCGAGKLEAGYWPTPGSVESPGPG